MLATNLSRYHLVVTGVAIVDHALARSKNLRPLIQSRCHLYHPSPNFKNYGCLLSVSCSRENLCRRLVICIEQIQCNGRHKLTVMCGQIRTSHQILMGRAVNLDALHPFILYWFYLIDVTVMAPRSRVSVHSTFLFTREPCDLHVAKSGELHIVKGLPGFDPSALTAWLGPVCPLCGNLCRDRIFDPKAPEKFTDTL